MKRTIICILGVLLASLILLMAVPAAAQDTLEVNGPLVQATTDGNHYMGSYSPDGSQIVCTGAGGIYVMNADGSSPTLIYPSGSRPKWGPTGLIALAGTGITIIQPDGTLVKTIDISHQYPPDPARTETQTHSLDWSPDGSMIAFATSQWTSAIWTVNFDGTGLTQITDYSQTAYGPAWSPDGTEIACAWGPSSNMHVGVFAADGSGLHREIGIGGSYGGDYPDWGANNKIAYHDGTSALHVMDADGSNDTVVSAGPAKMVAWSPNGKRIAYLNTMGGDVFSRGYPYTSIQAAINAATAGDTILVAAGTYGESVQLNEAVTLLGANHDVDPAGSTDRGGESVINGGQVEITAAGAIFNGFKLDGNRVYINGATDATASYNIIVNSSAHGVRLDPSSTNANIIYNTISNPDWDGICNYVGNSGVNISHNHITGVTDQNAIESGSHTGTGVQITYNVISGCTGAKGINYWGGPGPVISYNQISGTSDYLEAIYSDAKANTIEGNIISNTGGPGIQLYPPMSWDPVASASEGTVIRNNQITNTKYQGITVYGHAYTEISGNTLSNCNYSGADGTGDWDYAGIHLETPQPPNWGPDADGYPCDYCLIDNNTVTDGINGIQVWSSNCTITNNTVTNMGLTYADSKTVDADTYYNSGIIVGGIPGIAVSPTGTLVQGNTLTGNVVGLFVHAPVTPITISADTNNFTNNGTQLVDEAEALNMENVLASNTFNRAVTVDHPTSSLLHTIWSSIQDGIDNAEAGDTVNVAPGEYAGAIVDESVKLVGAADGSSVITSGVPYKPGNDSHKSAFRPEADGAEIRNFTINCNVAEKFDLGIYAMGVDGVIIDSLTINSEGSVQGISNWGGSNWQITNNVITNTVASGGGGIGIYLGAKPVNDYSGTPFPVCSNNLVQYNTINATATAEGYSCPAICVCLDLRYGGYDNIASTEDVSGNQILDNDITSNGAPNSVGIEVGTILGNSETDPDRTDPVKIAAIMAAAAVHDNTVQGNTSDGVETGIYFYNSTDLTIFQNTIENSVSDGIYAEHAQSGTTITGNTLSNNQIQLKDDTVDTETLDPLDIADIFTNNTFDRSVTVDHPGSSPLHTIWSNIQDGIANAVGGDAVNVGPGTYPEALNLGAKSLTIDGAGVDVTIVDASAETGYAVQNFGNSTTISDLTLIGTDNYGFKVSNVSNITFDSVKVEDSGKTAFDLNTIDTATLTNIEAVNTASGFGLMILDSNNITVTNIATNGNAWGGVSIQTAGAPSSSITFSGSFDAQEDAPLLLEKDPPYHDITGVTIPSKLTHIDYAFREGNNYQQWFYQETVDSAKVFAQALMDSTIFTYSDMLIYDIAQANYYVIEGMLIQDAIAEATPGDTINVAAGTYVEAIVIDKPLTLRGATADVNKNGYTVPADYAWDDTVESIIMHPDPAGGYLAIVDILDLSNVTFEGFIVQELNAEANLNSSLIRVRAQTQEISNIVVRNNVIGPNTNVVSQDGTHGRMGLYLVNNPYSDQFGIVNSTFSGNKIFGCEGNGNNVFIWSSYLDYGAAGPASMAGTVIEDNEIYGAHRSGIETAGGFSDLTICNNSIYGNGGPGITGKPALMFGNGVVMIRGSGDRENVDGYGPVNVTLEDNDIHDNDGYGIYMGPNNQGVTFTGNDVQNNGQDGIIVDLIGNYWNPDFEPDTGPHTNLAGSLDVAGSFNNIYDNAGLDVRVNGDPTNGFVFDATNNWWGTRSEAVIATKVSDHVDYKPYIRGDVTETKSEKTEAGDANVDAKDEANTEVEKKGTGTPTVTVAKYKDNPGAGFSGDTGSYIDVHLDDTEDVEEITIKLYYTEAEIAGKIESSLRLLWWNGVEWIVCSDSGVNTTDIPGPPAYSGYMWAKIRADTIPNLSQMSGTVFGGGGETSEPVPVPTPGPGTIGGGAPSPDKHYLIIDMLGKRTLVEINESTNTTLEELLAYDANLMHLLELEADTLIRCGDCEGGNCYPEIIVMSLSDETIEPPEGMTLVGPIYDFTGYTDIHQETACDLATYFDPMATVLLNYDPELLPLSASEPVIGFYSHTNNNWVLLPPDTGRVAEVGVATGVAEYFASPFAVLASTTPTEETPEPPPSNPSPAHFVASGLSITPAEVKTGEAVTISLNVANDGEESGTYTAELQINGSTVDSKVVTLDGGQSQSVSFAVTSSEAGTYDASVAGLNGSFTVVKSSIWWIYLIIGAVVIILGLLALSFRRGRG